MARVKRRVAITVNYRSPSGSDTAVPSRSIIETARAVTVEHRFWHCVLKEDNGIVAATIAGRVHRDCLWFALAGFMTR